MYKTYRGGEGKSPVKDKSQEREKRQWMNQWKRQCYGRTQTLDLENGTILFLFSTSLSHIGSEIEKRKIARAQSKKTRSPLDWKKKKKKSSQKCLPSLKPFTTLDLVSFNFFFLAHRSFLWLARDSDSDLDLHLLPPYQISNGKPCWKTLKGTKKSQTTSPRLYLNDFAAWRVQDIFNAPTSMGVKGDYKLAYSTC